MNVLDKLALMLYGMDIQTGRNQGICIDCKNNIWNLCNTERDWKEYIVSGLCPRCFYKFDPNESYDTSMFGRAVEDSWKDQQYLRLVAVKQSENVKLV